jgi:hypothetical protein
LPLVIQKNHRHQTDTRITSKTGMMKNVRKGPKQ